MAKRLLFDNSGNKSFFSHFYAPQAPPRLSSQYRITWKRDGKRETGKENARQLEGERQSEKTGDRQKMKESECKKRSWRDIKRDEESQRPSKLFKAIQNHYNRLCK